MRRATCLAAALLTLTILLPACGGSDKTPGGSDSSSGAPPAAPVDATATTKESFLDLQPIAPPEAKTGSDATLGGTPNRRAATFVNQQIKAAGLTQKGLEAFVLPVSGSFDELLIVEMDAAAGAVFPDDPLPLLKTLITVQGLEIANVTRIVINYRATDKDGPYVLTITMPLSIASQLVSGAITQNQAFAETRMEMKRPTP